MVALARSVPDTCNSQLLPTSVRGATPRIIRTQGQGRRYHHLRLPTQHQQRQRQAQAQTAAVYTHVPVHARGAWAGVRSAELGLVTVHDCVDRTVRRLRDEYTMSAK